MEEASKYTLFHAHGSGSVFPHTVLRLLEIPHEIVQCNYDEVTQKRGSDYARLVKANPLAQFPTLITPEGNVMTEMVAIVLYLQHRHAGGTSWGTNKLSPSQLTAFYRWFIFIPANVYPILTMGEFPGRFIRVPVNSGISPDLVEGWVTQGAYARREELWRMLEAEMTREMGGARFLLGTEQPTLLDVFVAMMAHFMPHIGRGTAWFIKNCPRLHESVQATLEIRTVRETFGESGLNEYSKHS